MLKHLARLGMNFLFHIFNLSWSLNSFPSIWKTSSDIPIHSHLINGNVRRCLPDRKEGIKSTSCFLFPLTCSQFFNDMLGISEPGALNYYTSSCLIPLTLFVSRNLTLIHLPLYKSLDSLLCNLIAPISGLTFLL